MALAMLRSEYWDSLSKTSSEFWIKVIRVHEVVMFLMILCIFAPLLSVVDFGAKLAIPTVLDESFNTIGSNPLYGYPIQLNGHSCWPADLNMCLQQPSSLDPCCTELYDKEANIEQTVSDGELMLIITCVSIGVLVLRCVMWQAVTSRHEKKQQRLRTERPNSEQSEEIHVDKRFWWKVLWDSLLALAISVIMTFIITDYVKEAVGAPRPNYYALQLFSSVYHSDRTQYEGIYASRCCINSNTLKSLKHLLFIALF